MTDIKRMEGPTDFICEKCGKPMVIKWGKHGQLHRLHRLSGMHQHARAARYRGARRIRAGRGGDTATTAAVPWCSRKGASGSFWRARGYPDCKTTKQLGAAQKPQDVPLDEKCPKCGNNMVRKYGRYGEFVACSNYPTCKYVKQKTIGVKCPNCSEGEVVERRSKRGKTFYGCNRYPDCDFVAWGKPIQEKCPDCGGSYLIEKFLKAGPVAQCPNDECKFKKPLPPPEKVEEVPVEVQA